MATRKRRNTVRRERRSYEEDMTGREMGKWHENMSITEEEQGGSTIIRSLVKERNRKNKTVKKEQEGRRNIENKKENYERIKKTAGKRA